MIEGIEGKEGKEGKGGIKGIATKTMIIFVSQTVYEHRVAQQYQ